MIKTLNALVTLFLLAASCAAATLTVTKTADTNDGVCNSDCSLREAVAVAASGDSIVFASPLFDTGQTISLNGQITIDRNLTINGRGANLTTIRNIAAASATSRVFLITTGTVNISGVTISGGNVNAGTTALDCGTTITCGGGVYSSGELTLTNCVVSDNLATGNIVLGGGIYASTGTLRVIGSTVRNNISNGPFSVGGGIYLGSNTAFVVNSTISGNSSFATTGGQAAGINVNFSTLNIANSTISNNLVSNVGNGGGVHLASGTMNAVNTIISGNSAPSLPDLRGTPSASSTNNLIGGDAKLLPLGNYGGTVPTHAPAAGSSAINAGNGCVLTQTCATFNAPVALTTDQRGRPRVGQVDIGAFEAPAGLVVTNTLNSGAGSLRDAVAAANATTTDESITFNIPTSDPGCVNGVCTITLTSGEIAVNSATTAGVLSIDNTSGTRDNLIVSGNNSSRIFNVAAGGNLTINKVTMTRGRTAANQNNGGAISNAGSLTLLNSAVTLSSASVSSNGGGLSNTGDLMLSDTIVSGNTANSTSGAIYNDGGTLSLTNSTIIGNSAVTEAGGIYSKNGSFNLSNSTVSSNSVSIGLGGGISTLGGSMNMANSTVSGNSSGGSGGGVNIANSGTVSLTGSTFSGNTSGNASGGGISNSGTLNMSNCTVSGNSAGAFSVGGGIRSSGTLQARNTIISGNTAGSNPDLSGTPSVSENNLIGGASFAPLGNYGGATQTHALLSNATTAINAGNNCVLNQSCATFNAPVPLTTDQRGAPRIGNVDIGAFEVNNSANGGTFKATLPTGRINTAYSSIIVPTTVAGFTYTQTAGTLPQGLSLGATALAGASDLTQTPQAGFGLTGTPTSGGSFNFSITASDGTNTSVTDYTMQVLAPTSAGVGISGRILTPTGPGLANAIVAITDSTGQTRTVKTAALGYFSFDGVESGQTVVIGVRSRKFSFAPTVVFLTDSIADIEFIGVR